MVKIRHPEKFSYSNDLNQKQSTFFVDFMAGIRTIAKATIPSQSGAPTL